MDEKAKVTPAEMSDEQLAAASSEAQHKFSAAWDEREALYEERRRRRPLKSSTWTKADMQKAKANETPLTPRLNITPASMTDVQLADNIADRAQRVAHTDKKIKQAKGPKPRIPRTHVRDLEATRGNHQSELLGLHIERLRRQFYELTHNLTTREPDELPSLQIVVR